MTERSFLIQNKRALLRAGLINLPHGKVETPAFMPIATRGAVRVASFLALEQLGAQIALSNTYHLVVRPGVDVIEKNGGLNKFTGWKKPFLTDSGGFQVFSLAAKRVISDEGVIFRSIVDGAEIKLTPESVVDAQFEFGSDISMVLDEVCALPGEKAVIEQAMRRTTDWAKRAKDRFVGLKKNDGVQPLLFGIVQGGTDATLRKKSAEDLMGIGFDGYAIGGLSVGEEAVEMYQTLDVTLPFLDMEKPRYLMGVGEPENIVEAVRRGVDMFDCVLPTRNARHGTLYQDLNIDYLREILLRPLNEPVDAEKLYRKIHIRNSQFIVDTRPINPYCSQLEGVNHSYLRHLFQASEPMALQLATINNLWFFLEMMRKIREIIVSA
ncbi:MAG: tRNA guanosine(34) transglycosylase Tgt [bacterium]|nr:tRNA guanosine(34) transglycosylase Tgt [bacterium]